MSHSNEQHNDNKLAAALHSGYINDDNAYNNNTCNNCNKL